MYKLYRYLFLPKHCSESKWERLCLYGTKNYKEMSTEKRRRLHGMLQEGWEGLKIKHRHLSIVLKQATHWLCLMLLLAINLITRCFWVSSFVLHGHANLTHIEVGLDFKIFPFKKYVVFLSIQSKLCTLVFLIIDQAPNNHPGHQNSGFSWAMAQIII